MNFRRIIRLNDFKKIYPTPLQHDQIARRGSPLFTPSQTLDLSKSNLADQLAAASDPAEGLHQRLVRTNWLCRMEVKVIHPQGTGQVNQA